MKKKYSFMATDFHPETGVWRFEFDIYADNEHYAYWEARRLLERNFMHYGHANAKLKIMAVDKTMKSVKHPCCNCVYFDACGESSRTQPCAGRQTKTEAKAGGKENGKNLL